MKELFTWGILIYNKNTIRDRKFYKIQRSKNNSINKIIYKKINIVKCFYTKTT